MNIVTQILWLIIFQIEQKNLDLSWDKFFYDIANLYCVRGSQISHQEKSFFFLLENSNIIIRGSLVGVGGVRIIEQFPEKGSKFFLAEIHCW